MDADSSQNNSRMHTGQESATSTEVAMDDAWEKNFLEQGSASFCCPLARRRSAEDAWRDLL